MVDAQRKMLDELMGANRDGDKDESKSYWDEDVCKNYLQGVCLSDVFTNTKADLGECPRVHNPLLKAAYEEDEKKGVDHSNFEVQLYHVLERTLSQCDRSIEKASLERTSERNASGEHAQLCIKLAGEIQLKLAEAETAGEEGDVDLSVKLMAEVEALKVKKAQAQTQMQLAEDKSVEKSQQKLQVCDICGALLSLYDSDRRLADHFGGKLHVGYMTLRARHAELREKYRGTTRLEQRGPAGGGGGGHRGGEREHHREGRDRERERERDRDRDRDRRDYRGGGGGGGGYERGRDHRDRPYPYPGERSSASRYGRTNDPRDRERERYRR